ncbi:MAG: TIGR02996 domain-containing protein [Myxococcales bacterium]|nr:TIGR02996 domain-containing protein [Myxococcales bacterium]
MKQVVARYERGEAPVDFIELELDADGLGLSVRQAEGERRSRFESAAAARWERDREVASALARGYRPLSVAPEVELSDDELDAALRARPDDRETFLVYADWLQARGEPRGELICVQSALAECRQRLRRAREGREALHATLQQLERAEILLLTLHRGRFFGPQLGAVARIDVQTYYSDLLYLDWQLGFVRRAAINGRRMPMRSDRCRGLWKALRETRSAMLLREAEVHVDDLPGLLPLPDSLERLELFGADDEDDDGPRFRDDDDEAASPRADAGISPALDELLHYPGRGLRQLVLAAGPYRTPLLRALVDSRVLEQLEALHLSEGLLDPDDAAIFVAHADAFAHLARLDFSLCRLRAATERELRALGGHVVTRPRERAPS